MAQGMIPQPGAENGPCEEACQHPNCVKARGIAEAICTYCGYEIGYESPFYQGEDKRFMHKICLEEDLERSR